MGTRNLVCVVNKGEYKIAQYGQWDGYFSGQGTTVADFIIANLKTKNGIKKFIEKLNTVKHLSDDDVSKRWKKFTGGKKYATMDQNDKFQAKYPQLGRDCGANVLEYVLNNEGAELKLDTDFAADSLFCEFCYVLDMDKKVLEIYTGFNKKPLPKKQRFANLERAKDSEYYPVKLFRKISFKDLKKNTMKNLKEPVGDVD